MLQKYLSYLRFVGGDVPYGAVEGNKLKHRAIGTSKRYADQTTFLTISPNNHGNARSIRLSHSSVDNKTFPAKFEDGCPYGRDGEDFIRHLVQDGVVMSDGTIDIPEGYLSKSERAALGHSNPVAFVSENKRLLYDILDILIGITPDNAGFYPRKEGESKRKSRHYRRKKGIFGHCLTLIGVTEDHAKGHLHWHLMVNAGINSYALQRFANIPVLCQRISEVLNSMYSSELSTEAQVASIVRRLVIKKRKHWQVDKKVIDSMEPEDPLIRRSNAMEEVQAGAEDPMNHEKLAKLTQCDAAGKQVHHSTPHLMTCHKGTWGKSGCRLNMPCHCTDCTTGVMLVPRKKTKIKNDIFQLCETMVENNDSESVEIHDFSPSPTTWEQHPEFGPSRNSTAPPKHSVGTPPGQVTQTVSPPMVDDLSSTSASFSETDSQILEPTPKDILKEYFERMAWTDDPVEDVHDMRYDVYDFSKHSLTQGIDSKYKKLNILERQADHSVIVWETKRRALEVPDFCKNVLQNEAEQTSFVHSLQVHLNAMQPFDKKESKFWQWLEQTATLEQVQDIQEELKAKLPLANGYIAAYSPAMLFLTGSHNNTVPLGSMVQAKGAMFYLIPYQGKNKFPIAQSLVVLNKALEHVEKYKTQSTKGDKGTLQRTATHLLQRTFNRMDLMMELSDYQVTAALLELPSMIMADNFQYGDPVALDAFRSYKEMQEEELESLDDLYNAIADARERQRMAAQVNVSFFPETHVENEFHANDVPQDEDLPFRQSNYKTKETEEDEDAATWSDGSFIAPEDDSISSSATKEDADPSIQDDLRPDECIKPSIPAHTLDVLLANLGHITKINLKEQQKAKNEKNPMSMFVPTVALYEHRAKPDEPLGKLNYYEYLACIKFMNTPANAVTVVDNRSAQQYALTPDFPGSTDCHHQLKLKQSTPLLLRNVPPLPGSKPRVPVFSIPYQKWKTKADAYARYHLLLFRPETFSTKLSYNWEDLEDWISHLEEDPSAISKGRIIIMKRHMKGLWISKVTKRMLLDYRSRARDLWTDEEKQFYQVQQALHFQMPAKDKFQDMMDSMEGEELSRRALQSAITQLNHDLQQDSMVQRLFADTNFSKNVANVSLMDSARKNMQRCIHKSNSIYTVCKKGQAMHDWKRDATMLNTPSVPQGSHNSSGRAIAYQNLRKELTENRTEAQCKQQLEIYDLYANHFLDPACPPPPPSVFVHGGPGVGKTKVRNSIMKASELDGRKNLKTAFNCINAAEMRGSTTAYLIALNTGYHMVAFGRYRADVIKQLQSENFDTRDMLFIEEVSTEAPWHVAHLCRFCQTINNNFVDPYGGRRSYLTGDLTQLGPVNATSIAKATMDIYANAEVQLWMNARRKPRNKSKATLIPSDTDDMNRCLANHPYRTGVDLLTKNIRLFELTQQQRAIKDPAHTNLCLRNYRGERINLRDIIDRYKQLSSSDMDQPEWLEAPCLVSTNRERRTLTHTRAVQFAIAKKTIVIRWLTGYKNWSNAPDSSLFHLAMRDPCFYEYYVTECFGYMTANIQKHLDLVNGIKIQYHSLVLDDETEEWLQGEMQVAKVGAVLTLPRRPVAINVRIFFQDSTPDDIMTVLKQQFAVDEVELEGPNKMSVVIPILKPTSCNWDNDQTPVCGSSFFGPSKVLLGTVFPVEPAFAITVHKSEGQTMARVIIALSPCPLRVCQFNFEQFHVASSRVEESEHMRLLLVGDTEAQRWQSLAYLTNLRQHPSVKFYFAGFRDLSAGENPNEGWLTNAWSAERANEQFLKLIAENKV